MFCTYFIEEETTEGSRKSVRIVSLENKYKESDEDEDDIYLPFSKSGEITQVYVAFIGSRTKAPPLQKGPQ